MEIPDLRIIALASTMRLLLVILLSFILILAEGCASTPPALIPAPTHVQGLAIIPQTEAAKKALGRNQPLIIQNSQQQSNLFSVLEMNKTDASTSNLDVASHDFVVRWKLNDENGMDRSQLYLRLGNPKTFVYESDLGGSTRKYIIKVPDEDARAVWKVVGVTPPEWSS